MKKMNLNEVLKLEYENQTEILEGEKEYTSYEYLQTLKEQMRCFDKKKDYSYLLQIFPKLSKVLSSEESKNKKEHLTSLLESIRLMVVKLLASFSDLEKEMKSYASLLEIVDQLESLSLAQEYALEGKYDGTVYHFLSYLLFEYRNPYLLEDAFRRYPYLANTTYQGNQKLFLQVLDKMEEEIELYNKNQVEEVNQNLLYYDKILTIFLNDKEFKLTANERRKILRDLRKKVEQVGYFILDTRVKKKMTFWLNEIITKFKDKTEELERPSYLLYKYDISSSFDDAVLSEAKHLFLPSSKNRRSVEDEYIIAIDDVSASEIDDAISIKKLEGGRYLLGVHIADIYGGLRHHPLLLEEAINRGTSIYLSDGGYFLFPEVIGSEMFSLKAGNKKFANSFYLTINQSGEVEEVKFEETIIRVSENVSYRDADAILQYGLCDNPHLLKTLEELNELTTIVRSKLQMDPIYKYAARRHKNASNTVPEIRYRSFKLVETAMILTNRELAKYFYLHNLPFVYRNHQIDDALKTKLDALRLELSTVKKQDISRLMRQLSLYPKAYYETENKGHEGLQLEYYTHITSPLRRSADILGTMCLKKFYFNKIEDNEAYKIEEYLRETCKKINGRCQNANEFLKVYEKRR